MFRFSKYRQILSKGCCFIALPEFLALCWKYGIRALFPVFQGGCSLLSLSLMLAVHVCRYFFIMLKPLHSNIILVFIMNMYWILSNIPLCNILHKLWWSCGFPSSPCNVVGCTVWFSNTEPALHLCVVGTSFCVLLNFNC